MDSKSFENVKKEELSIQLQPSSVPQLENPRPSNLRYVDNFKRQFAEQEFNAIKRRYRGQQGQTYTCCHDENLNNSSMSDSQVRKEERNVKRTEREKHMFCSISRTNLNKYVYVSNLCVAKSARRQSIASNMLYFVVESARSKGVEPVYVHVHRNNEPALELYQKIGFEMVEMANSLLLKQQMYLLRYKT
ncbi:Ankyrin repeat-containing-like protein [Hibiscus syriacus]|uniref:Ankyrin repeat-containing-like protein n=1 Tax=Hibiscus syriacus TaxID=106335 RepID=A0A6A2WGQ7_HIBSY|nr:Ankyrin repeat-containing-like protein [Hibiscus syriacus]